jgi:hypothetical protein
MIKESFYFPHDYDATADPKMQALLGKYGGLGYGVFWRTIEMLHSNSDHKLPLKPYIYSAIAKQMLTGDEQMLEIISYCIDFCELFTSDGECFWSNRVNQNFEKRAEISEKRSFAGKLGVAAKANAKQNLANVSKGKEKKGKEIKEKKIFITPTINEIRAYCLERKNKIDAQLFIDKYIGNGWMVGKNKMKDWKAVVRTWEKNDFNTGGTYGNRQTAGSNRGNYGRDRVLDAKTEDELATITRELQEANKLTANGHGKEKSI